MSSSEDKSLTSPVSSGVVGSGKEIANTITKFGRDYASIDQFQIDRVSPEVCLQCHGSVLHGERFCSQFCAMQYWHEFQEYSHRTSGSIPTKLVPLSVELIRNAKYRRIDMYSSMCNIVMLHKWLNFSMSVKQKCQCPPQCNTCT